MLSLKPEKIEIEPFAFKDQLFFQNKIPRKLQYIPDVRSTADLLKHFPKYCKHLSLYKRTGAFESKVKRLKIVRFCDDKTDPTNNEKRLKRLFQTSRKTLKRIPVSHLVSEDYYEKKQYLSLCSYFSGVKYLNLRKNRLQERFLDKSTLKGIYRSFGYFWSGCQFVENLKVSPYYTCDLAVIKKINNSKRFLSSVKKIKFTLNEIYGDPEMSRRILIELLENKNFLKHVTHLRIRHYNDTGPDWEVIQLLINSCPQLHFVSSPTGWLNSHFNPRHPNFINKKFCLDLSSLENLQVLHMTVKQFKIFINGIQFPPFLREMILEISDFEGLESMEKFFDCQGDDEMAQDQENFEKSRMLNNFFEKINKLENLETLNLTLRYYFDMETLLIDFVLPLLRAVPKLETFDSRFDYGGFSRQHSESLDLEGFFYEIESLQSLRHLKISTNDILNCVFSGFAHPQKLSALSNLSSIEIDYQIHSQFNLKQFLNVFLCKNTNMIKKNVKLSRLHLFSAQDFIRLLNVMHSFSDFTNFQADLQIGLTIENIEEIYENFKYPIYVPSNTLLAVTIFRKNFKSKTLTQEEEQYFQIIFGQLQISFK